MRVFGPADILLPRSAPMETWSVIACDQFTSQPEYWQRVKQNVAGAPSTLHMILPEANLSDHDDAAIAAIGETMRRYLDDGIFEEKKQAMVYVERTMKNGTIRKGLVGAINLWAYDFHKGATTLVRATEETVTERIPPRVKIRQQAALELPHVLVLYDDEQQRLNACLEEMKEDLPKLYDFELMEGGGHIAGWLVQGEAAQRVCAVIDAYEEEKLRAAAKAGEAPLLYAMGDGNHSLAAAKACCEVMQARSSGQMPGDHPMAYALVELVNLHDPAMLFEPIHRLVHTRAPMRLLERMKQAIGSESGYPVIWHCGGESGTVYLDESKGSMAVGVLQAFLDEELPLCGGTSDYIHGEEALCQLAAQENAIGLRLPDLRKKKVFARICEDGVLPRKTFSMGHSEEKRYYLEARRIRPQE